MTKFNPAILNILVCPASKGRLTYDEAAQELLCQSSSLAYPVNKGVPILVLSEARHFDSDKVIFTQSSAASASPKV